MTITILKTDLFGSVALFEGNAAQQLWRDMNVHGTCPEALVCRDITRARRLWRGIARRLAAREARVLAALPPGPWPQLVCWKNGRLLRTWLPGQPMQVAERQSPDYFSAARAALVSLHQSNVVHNDLAKEPNWLVSPAGEPIIIDFQLAWPVRRRRGLFRLLAREDLRHLLKHKRTYHPDLLTAREQHILATPASFNRIWMRTGKRVYLFVTRRILNWSDREGAGDRQLRNSNVPAGTSDASDAPSIDSKRADK